MPEEVKSPEFFPRLAPGLPKGLKRMTTKERREELISEALKDDPNDNLPHHLEQAQAHLIRVREMLGEKKLVEHEKRAMNLLRLLGDLRFELNEAKLLEVPKEPKQVKVGRPPNPSSSCSSASND